MKINIIYIRTKALAKGSRKFWNMNLPTDLHWAAKQIRKFTCKCTQVVQKSHFDATSWLLWALPFRTRSHYAGAKWWKTLVELRGNLISIKVNASQRSARKSWPNEVANLDPRLSLLSLPCRWMSLRRWQQGRKRRESLGSRLRSCKQMQVSNLRRRLARAHKKLLRQFRVASCLEGNPVCFTPSQPLLGPPCHVGLGKSVEDVPNNGCEGPKWSREKSWQAARNNWNILFTNQMEELC